MSNSSYLLVYNQGQEVEISLTFEELKVLSAFIFIVRMAASLQLLTLYKREKDGNLSVLEIVYPMNNDFIVQIFPTADPLRYYPSREEFLREVKNETNTSAMTTNMGSEYVQNLDMLQKRRDLFPILLRWGFPSSVPNPPWNGMSLLALSNRQSLDNLADIINMLGYNPTDHVRLI